MLPYKLRTENETLIVDVVALGLAEGPELDAMAARLQEELMRSKTKKMVFDCSRLKFMASRGLSVIVTLSRLAEQQKGGLVVCGLQPQLVQIFRLSGVDRFLPICGTRDEALARLPAAPGEAGAKHDL